MIDDLIQTAGPVPARAPGARWHQAALLATAAALGGDPAARTRLGCVLQALDLPDAAEAAVDGLEVPWARWWHVVAIGQRRPVELADAVAATLEDLVPVDPDAREVRRRLEDLAEELRAMDGSDPSRARFSLQGVCTDTPARALLTGRSSASFVAEPGWEAMRLVRLAPSDGPQAGNRAHLPIGDIIELVARGDRGADRPVPPDRPAMLAPDDLLNGVREDRGVRDQRLLDLADEVRSEREVLAVERSQLRQQKAALAAAMRQVKDMADRGVVAAAGQLPSSRAEAAALLEVDVDAPATEVERAFKRQVVRCHPDRVEGLHPTIRGHAEGLTVALTAARDMLKGVPSAARRRS